MNDSLQSYLQTISLIRSFPAKAREQGFSAVGQEHGGDPMDPLSLTRQLTMVKKHIDILASPATSDPWKEILNTIRSDEGYSFIPENGGLR